MIVENDEFFHNLYQTMLKGLGHKFIHTYDGYEAMEKMEDTIPDVIILDLLMDLITGDTFFKYLKNILNYLNIPVIIINSIPKIQYSHLREIDPEQVFIEKQFLTRTRERLIHEIDEKVIESMNENSLVLFASSASA